MGIRFFIPGIGDNRLAALNKSLIKHMEEFPEKFRDISIGAVYGSYPSTTWSGGRFCSGYFTGEYIMNEVMYYNSKNIPVRYTFTNTLVTQEDLFDQTCNTVMNISNNGMNEVLVNNDTLEKYIRENYPNYKVVLSTTKRITEKEQYDQYKGKYYMVVLDYSFNHKPDIWELDNKKDIELLIMTFCEDECPNRMHHQFVTNSSNRNLDSFNQHYGTFTCPYFQGEDRRDWTFYDHLAAHKNAILVDDLYGKYVDAGFCNFKLEGRGNNIFDVMESYIYYMVLPEYRNEIRLSIAKDITGLNTEVKEEATTAK